jgi:glycosyltransferase involved in cell wall biosynthesis
VTTRALFAIPGDPETPTGGYVYDARLRAAAGAAGMSLPLLPLTGGFPDPSAADIDRALAALARADAPLLIDGLALGTLPGAAIAALPVPVIALLHHPLGLETGLTPARRDAMLAVEAAALAACAHVITTSRTTADTAAELLGVPRAKLTVAAPGLDRAPAARRAGRPAMILGVGTISRRKGWDVLVEALAQMGDLAWRCTILGPDDREPATAAALRARIARMEGADPRLAGRLRLTGALDRAALDAAYQGADIFCLPSRYEGYGMVATEAMAHGLPVIVSAAGALPEAVGDAGLLVPPDDPGALAAALRRLLTDTDEADRRAAASHARAAALPGWDATAAIVAGVLRSHGARS